MSVDTKYRKYSQIEHILKKPEMYVGSVNLTEGPMWILDQNRIIEKIIDFVPGLYKIFDEIIVNAHDQFIEDPSLTTIKVNIDKNQISVFNDGRGIDVVIHPKEQIYVPELIFGELLTSSHFNENEIRVTGGTFGIGSKATNIFSKSFSVEIGDPKNGLSFKQIFSDNLSKRTKPVIKPYTKTNGYVRITFTPDFEYFKIKEFSDDMIRLMERRVYDIAMLCGKKVKVYLNDTLIPINSMTQYIEMITDQQIIIDKCTNQEAMNRWTLGFTRSSDGFKCISFVNGVNTWNGGTHVNNIMTKVLKGMRQIVEKKYKDLTIRDQVLKDQMLCIISATIENPSFNSQSKDELVSPADKFGSMCQIDQKTIKKLYDLLGIDALVEKMESNLIQKQPVTHKIKNIPKLYDAYWAGTKKSSQCTLILTEGDSAKTMAISGLSALNDPKKNIKGNDFYGVFPLKGKLLNVREATKKKIAENEEFVNLKKIIGLEMGKEYDENNIHDLRYGKGIILFMDADVDGDHIKGLFLNMLDFFWPSLLKIPDFLKIFITPVIKTFQNNQVNEFFSITAYNEWKQKNQSSNYTIKYYKGLGTSNTMEAKAYFTDLGKYLIDVRWDKDSAESIDLAFSKDKADDRKKWLKNYDPLIVPDFNIKYITHSDFINKELIHFSNYDNERSIPSLIDGLKPSQRKILFCAFKKNLTTDIKVAQFIGYVSEHASYHHGEASLAKAIIAMAQNFVGSNNINLLVPSGQYGSRLQNGQDAASPRYIFTRLEEVTRLIFDPRDDILLNYQMDENLSIEPEYYVPIIPMVLVNGPSGIGTGFSTFLTNFNPLDLIEILLERLDKSLNVKLSKSKHIYPWYADYTGKINKITNDQYEALGRYEFDQESQVLRILEIPVGRSTESYKAFLEEDMRDYISKIKNNSDDTTVDFVIKLKQPVAEPEIIKKFQLSLRLNLGNIYLHDKDGKLKKYKGVHEIIDEFFDVRMRYYVLRKQSILKILREEIDYLEKKLKFILFVISNKKVFEMKKSSIIDMLIKEKIIGPKDQGIETKGKKSKELKEEELNKDSNTEGQKSFLEVFFRMPFQSFTKEKTEELKTMIDNKKKEYAKIEKITTEDMWKEDLNRLKQHLLAIK